MQDHIISNIAKKRLPNHFNRLILIYSSYFFQHYSKLYLFPRSFSDSAHHSFASNWILAHKGNNIEIERFTNKCALIFVISVPLAQLKKKTWLIHYSNVLQCQLLAIQSWHLITKFSTFKTSAIAMAVTVGKTVGDQVLRPYSSPSSLLLLLLLFSFIYMVLNTNMIKDVFRF